MSECHPYDDACGPSGRCRNHGGIEDLNACLAAAEARAEAAEEKVSAWVKDYCTLALALADTFDRVEAADRDRDWWRARAEAVEALADEWRRQAVPGEWSSALHPRRAADAIRAALDAAAEDRPGLMDGYRPTRPLPRDLPDDHPNER